jgi:hypothetical protein
MRGVYKKMYTMGRNEAFGAFLLTIAVVVAYSLWGAHLLNKSHASAPAALMAGIGR